MECFAASVKCKPEFHSSAYSKETFFIQVNQFQLERLSLFFECVFAWPVVVLWKGRRAQGHVRTGYPNVARASNPFP